MISITQRIILALLSGIILVVVLFNKCILFLFSQASLFNSIKFKKKRLELKVSDQSMNFYLRRSVFICHVMRRNKTFNNSFIFLGKF